MRISSIVVLAMLFASCVGSEEDVGSAETPLLPPGDCAFDETYCSGDCVLILEDDAHCGGCNAACPADADCLNGRCV